MLNRRVFEQERLGKQTIIVTDVRAGRSCGATHQQNKTSPVPADPWRGAVA